MPALIESCSPQTLNKRMRGRPFGAKGKASESLRWGFVEAYRQLGGVDGLVKWGRKKPDLFYPLLTKLLPHELAEAGLGQPIRVVVYGTNETLPKDISPLVIESASKHIDEAETQESMNIRENGPA